MKIIIAHEDIVIRKSIRQMFELLGYHVLAEAANGLQAYNKFVEYHPDMILLGLDLPIHDGINTLKRIKGYAQASICVMIGEQLKNREIFEALEHGATHYLTLPVDEVQVEKVMTDIKYMKEVKHD